MGPGEILIVEDSEAVRTVMQAVLRLYGFETRVAANGEEALAWLRAGGLPRAVITDHLMSGMTGLELLGHVATLAPDAMQVLHTGLPSVEVPVRSGCALTVLAKPSSIAFLRRLATLALAEPSLLPGRA